MSSGNWFSQSLMSLRISLWSSLASGRSLYCARIALFSFRSAVRSLAERLPLLAAMVPFSQPSISRSSRAFFRNAGSTSEPSSSPPPVSSSVASSVGSSVTSSSDGSSVTSSSSSSSGSAGASPMPARASAKGLAAGAGAGAGAGAAACFTAMRPSTEVLCSSGGSVELRSPTYLVRNGCLRSSRAVGRSLGSFLKHAIRKLCSSSDMPEGSSG
mmetsp:Transcript_16287/g.63493  ORF Transcript_16287/g.63493 Transcript_16287/m.63493 type:complete len:214 (+) Transcript_16287:197-838(+)